MPFAGIAHTARRMWADESGLVSGETLLFLPLLVVPLLTLVDSAELHEKHSRMWTEAREAARGMSRYTWDAEQATGRVRDSLADFNTVVDIGIHDGDAIVVEISADFRAESTFRLIGFGATRMPARVIMRREPRLLDRLG